MMKKIILSSFAITGLLFLFSCSTAQVSVLPGQNFNRVVSKDIESDGAEEAAVDAAKKYCEKRGKEAIFLDTAGGTQYTGAMDEQTRKNVRNASKAGMILGGAGGTLSTGNTQAVGTVLGAGSTVGYAMTSDRDYKTELHFQCK